jgi:hypothetical protein
MAPEPGRLRDLLQMANTPNTKTKLATEPHIVTQPGTRATYSNRWQVAKPHSAVSCRDPRDVVKLQITPSDTFEDKLPLQHSIPKHPDLMTRRQES